MMRNHQHAARQRSYSHLRKATIRWLLRGAGAGLLLLLLAAAYLWLSTELPAPEHLRQRAALGSTRLLDRNGQLLYEVPDPFKGRQQPLALSDIPLALQQATIATEDGTFYRNTGIDLRGILRASWLNVRSGHLVAGGSTITQQLARSFLLEPELAQQRTLERKLREAVLALKLTAAYSKDEILALYLNQIYYGGMAYGVEAAAQHFFGKPARDLDLAECALLAGLPQSPTLLNPFTSPQAAQARQGEVLAAMVRAGYITPAEAEAARNEPLQFASDSTAMRAPHVVYYVLDLLTARLGADAVARGGLTITTTIDLDLQEAAQRILRQQIDQLSTPGADGIGHHVQNGAIVVLDPASGDILALVGSPDFANSAIQGQFNAALALRQPGSAMKPLTYAAALERGWTPATMILDVPSTFPTREGRPYSPHNYDRTYHGPLSLREALATSSNVAAVRVLQEIGIPALLEMAARLGITSLDEHSGRFGLALTLGGGEVTLLELTTAYAAFANGGQPVTPRAVLAMDGAPEPAFARPPAASGRPLSPQVAYLISDILSDRYARMHAFGEVSALDIDRPAAAKTGTTTDWRDNWTIGYTPDRVVGVWVGNADGQPMENVSGISGAGPIWHEVMLVAHRGQPPRPFARPDGIIELAVCADSGLLPAPDCPAVRLERFIAGSEPVRPDDTHVTMAIDPLRNCRAPAGYPPERTVRRTFRLLPPEAEAWAVDAGLPRLPAQTCAAEQPANDAQQPALPPPAAAPAVLAPASGAIFSITPGIPTAHQQIELRARAGGSIARLIIEVDGAPVATFHEPPYRAFWPPTAGNHQAVVIVEDGQGRQQRSLPAAFTVVEPE